MNIFHTRTPLNLAIWGFILLASATLLAGSLGNWLPFGLVEVFGFITGAVCVMMTVEESIWNWPLGLANNLVFIVLFLNQRLFADMALQGVYIAMGIFGWYNWLRGGSNHGILKIRRSGGTELMLLAAIGAAATWGMTLFLTSINDSAPFLDALTTVLSLLAQYLLTRKAIENWLVWMAADILYIGLYLSKGLTLTAILYALFLALCIGGLRVWRKTYSHNRAEATQNQENPA